MIGPLVQKGFDCLCLIHKHEAQRWEKGRWQASTALESAGGVSLAASRLAALPGSMRVVNRKGMLWGNCLGVKPNTRHIWQTVYSPHCIFSTKHGAWPIFSPNRRIPQPGSRCKCDLGGTVHGHAFTPSGRIGSEPSVLQRSTYAC